MCGYGLFLAARGRHAEAEAPLLNACQQLKETHQDRHERMYPMVAALVEVYDHLNRPDEAAKWRAQLSSFAPMTQPTTAPARE